MASAPNGPDTAPGGGPRTDRRERIAALRVAEQRRERRRTIITIWAATGILVAAVAGGSLALSAGGSKSKPKAAVPDAIPGVQTYTGLGRQHVLTKVDYPQTPPVGGNHNPTWLNCNGDLYDQPVHNENAVHSLEHGAVWATYNGKATAEDISALADRVRRTPYSFMSPYPDEKGTITLTAWGTQLVLDNANDPRVQQFFTKYVQGPQTPEPGASCTAGTMPLSPAPVSPGP